MQHRRPAISDQPAEGSNIILKAFQHLTWFKAIFDSTAIGICLTDTAGRIVDTNH